MALHGDHQGQGPRDGRPDIGFFDDLHREKYRLPGECRESWANRVAGALKGGDRLERLLLEQKFLPGGRIQRAAGSPDGVTCFNCFVSGPIEDFMGSILLRLGEAAMTMRMGGGIGYDFSRLRPRGARIRTLNAETSGPVAFMRVFDAMCKCICSAGHRRGAQMAVMRVDHPDILEFVRCKSQPGLEAFNISVGVTDAFMRAVEQGDHTFPLRFEGKEVSLVDPRELWREIARQAYQTGEPGVLFLDRINEQNNLWYAEGIEATNPCGEQPLPAHGACCLGSMNLARYVGRSMTELRSDVGAAVSALDEVIDHSNYPLEEQRLEAKAKRRLGLGVTGLANYLEAQGWAYGTAPFMAGMERVLTQVRDAAYQASHTRALSRGPFPAWAPAKYGAGYFVSRLPEELRRKVASDGARNSHVLSIAPTGTISLAAGNVSSGIEPVFAEVTLRKVAQEVVELPDYGVRVLGTKPRVAHQVSPEEHVDVAALAQRFVDSGVSKTVNVAQDLPLQSFIGIYHRAYKSGLKGLSVFRSGCEREGILSCSVGGSCE